MRFQNWKVMVLERPQRFFLSLYLHRSVTLKGNL